MFKLTLLLISLVLYTKSNTCTNTVPTQVSDCTNQQTSTNYCCYVQGVTNNNNTKMCYDVPVTSYAGVKTVTIRGSVYTMDCGANLAPITPLATCGPANATSKSDCMIKSTFENSCCYNPGYGNVTRNCYWLGAKYEGSIIWAGLELDCAGGYLSYSLFFVFLLLTIVF